MVRKYSVFDVRGKYMKTLGFSDSEVRKLRKSFPKATFRAVRKKK